MLTLDQIKARLDDRIMAVVSERTGIHRNTLGNIKSGKIDNPTYYVMRKLSEYLEAEK